MVRILVSLSLVALSGCANQLACQPVEVKIPVPVRAVAPVELMTPYTPGTLPRFVDPQDPVARAALSDADLNHLKSILRTYQTREEAWRAWADSPLSEPTP